ncbi:hypothetical protein K491DRAFT_99366 [Lophiostoma macrostomum CBS 122681]|uniref:Uncharacterized protein n=1 Tax=Lophiostoma macrostomum CBS 122681 TaxID=1314788 RepID=A0A6A6SUH5_9PLEO|nr:hypothetical protein K491DRAFT_99366 [Lophiostoma macrostomum CBS 122681]
MSFPTSMPSMQQLPVTPSQLGRLPNSSTAVQPSFHRILPSPDSTPPHNTDGSLSQAFPKAQQDAFQSPQNYTLMDDIHDYDSPGAHACRNHIIACAVQSNIPPLCVQLFKAGTTTGVPQPLFSAGINEIVHQMWQCAFRNRQVMAAIDVASGKFNPELLKTLATSNYLPSFWYLKTIAMQMLLKAGARYDDRDIVNMLEMVRRANILEAAGNQDGATKMRKLLQIPDAVFRIEFPEPTIAGYPPMNLSSVWTDTKLQQSPLQHHPHQSMLQQTPQQPSLQYPQHQSILQQAPQQPSLQHPSHQSILQQALQQSPLQLGQGQ